jgi:hypothetical protein
MILAPSEIVSNLEALRRTINGILDGARSRDVSLFLSFRSSEYMSANSSAFLGTTESCNLITVGREG